MIRRLSSALAWPKHFMKSQYHKLWYFLELIKLKMKNKWAQQQNKITIFNFLLKTKAKLLKLYFKLFQKPF